MQRRPFLLRILKEAGLCPGTIQPAATAEAEYRIIERAVQAGQLDWTAVGACVERAYAVAMATIPEAAAPAPVPAPELAAELHAAGLKPLGPCAGGWRVAWRHPDDNRTIDTLAFRWSVRFAPLFTPPPLWRLLDATIEGTPPVAAVGEAPPGPAAAHAGDLFAPWWAAAVRAGASDLHLQPEAGRYRWRMRVDGCLRDRGWLQPTVAERMLRQIRHRTGLPTDQPGVAQDGHLHAPPGSGWPDIRCSFIPAVAGDSAVFRLLQADTRIASLADLGFTPAEVAAIDRVLAAGNGLVLASGPTGCGKSTTLCHLLSRLADGTRKVLSIEDPVERRLPGVCQVAVDTARGRGFAEVLRAFLRQAPNVILVGEIRDSETAALVTRAALSGHLVLSSIHAGDALAGLDRLADLGVCRADAAHVTRLLLAQRLLRLRCTACAGAGCATCADTGYRGRRAVAECILPDAAWRQSWQAGAGACLHAAPDLRARARQLIAAGCTDDAEWQRVFGDGFHA
jgi:general secretion pathway protein E